MVSRSVEGLYFVGASTRPGTGVPLVTIGARLVAQRIGRELGQ
jgi:phytoene desaturase